MEVLCCHLEIGCMLTSRVAHGKLLLRKFVRVGLKNLGLSKLYNVTKNFNS